MAEKIYAIPVNDAFDRDCECPVCLMYNDLESDAIGFTLGPSYMDDRFRLQTDELGFCKNHLKMLYDRNNRLGLALMIKTHTDKTNKEIEAISKSPLKGGFFKKGNQALIDYLDSLSRTCFVCDRINALYDKYIYTVIYLYKTDPAFKKKICGDAEIITCRPADLIEPELDKLRGELDIRYVKQEEDVLSYAQFGQVAMKFFEQREKAEAAGQQAAEGAAEGDNAPANFTVTINGKAFDVSIE